MAKSETKDKCFIIMPITTPDHLVQRYNGDEDHFIHVLECLFMPAVEEAGFTPISPKATGSNIIHADIIKQLSESELVLCDMSILNPNVFYEFGIRTALDKPVALVVDDKTQTIPFDTGIINFHKYDSSLAPWLLEEQKQKLATHVQDAYKKSNNQNALWKYFGVAQTGKFKPEDVELGEKMDLLMKKVDMIETEQTTSTSPLDALKKSLGVLEEFAEFVARLEREGYIFDTRKVMKFLSNSPMVGKGRLRLDPYYFRIVNILEEKGLCRKSRGESRGQPL